MKWRPPWIDQRMASADHFSPCVCGKLNRATLYQNKLMSPEKTEIRFGLTLFIASTVFLLFFLWPLAIALVLLALIVEIILTVLWLAKHHSLTCSLRWAALNLFGLGRWI